MSNRFSFGDLLGRYKDHSRLSAADLAVLTGIPKTSIENWLQGTAGRPRDWAKVLQLAKALHLSAQETDALLQAARHPPLVQLAASQPSDEALQLIQSFYTPQAPVERPSLPAKKVHSIGSRPYATFHGRQLDLALLHHWLSAGDIRMIVVTGISGIGKSSLVWEAATRHADLFPFGMAYVNARQQHNLAVEAIAYAFLLDMVGAQVNQNENPLLLLQYYVRNCQWLLILDNANSLSGHEVDNFVEYIRDVLPEDGRSKLLMTTQAYGYEAAGWPFARILHLEEGLDEAAALALVKSMSQQTLPAEEEALVLQVVQRTHGHPKLLEVAIGVASRWGWARSYHDLKNQQGRVAAVMATMLTPVIDALPINARALLSSTTLFPSATFVIEEIHALHPSLPDLADLLERLTDHNLLNYRTETGVFQLHQLIGDYVERVLPLAAPQKQQGEEALVNHYLRALRHANDKALVMTGSERRTNNKLPMLLVNALGLLKTITHQSSTSAQSAGQIKIDLTLALAKTLRRSGLFAQGLELLNQLTQATPGGISGVQQPLLLFYVGEFAYQVRDLTNAAQALHHFLLATEGGISWERAQAFHYLAILHAYPRTHRYLPIEATDLFQAALHLWHRLGRRLPLAYVLNDLGYEKFQTTNHPAAPKWIAAALRIAERTPKRTPDDFRVWGIILRTTAHYYRDTKQWESAIAYFKQSSHELQHAANDLEWAETDYSFGRFLIDIERNEEGIAVLHGLIPRCQGAGYLHTLSNTWITLGKAYMQLNQFAEADAAYGMSLQIARSLAYEAKVMAQYITYYSMGRLAAERGYYDAAVSHYQQSLDLRRAIGHQERVSEVLYVMALALKQVGDDQGAFAVINESIATQQERNAIQEQAILERAQRLQDELRLNLAEKPK